MPQQSLSQKSFFAPEFVSPDSLKPGTVPWLLARRRFVLFPAWLLSGWRGEGRTGRKAWPSVVLLTLIFLRWSEAGMSRLASVKRANDDAAWRAAMGLAFGRKPPSEKTMREFEKFLLGRHAETGQPRYLLLHEHIVRLCATEGVVGPSAVWATDSTPMWCYGAVLDTVRLLGDGLRSLGRCWAKATDQSLEALAREWELPLLLAKSTKGSMSIDWRDSTARADAVSALAHDALRIVEWVRRHINEVRFGRGRLLDLCRTLARVVSNDLESDEEGRLVIARRVVKSRLISLTDRQARHGRKSRSHTFKGFKIHVVGDVVSGVIASVAVTEGNEHDSGPAPRLIRRVKDLFSAGLKRVLGDTAYGGARLRHIVKGTCGVELLAPPPPVSTKVGRFGKQDLDIDLGAKTVTCVNGVTTGEYELVSGPHNVRAPRFRWPAEVCCGCPLRDACLGKATGGHQVLLHPYEEELQAARDEWERPEVRLAYRTRSQCERLVNQVIRHGGRKARSWGLGAAQLQAHAIVATCNLKLLAKAFAVQAPEEVRLAA